MTSPDAWFWHTSEWEAYTLEYRPDLRGVDRSFFICNGSTILGLCPLILETTVEGGREVRDFAFAGGPGPAPALARGLSADKRARVLGAIVEHLDLLAAENDVECAQMRFTPLVGPSLPWPAYNQLVRYGFLDVSLNTQVIDLSLGLDQLRCDVRKGHWHDIKRGCNMIDVDVFDGAVATRRAFRGYVAMHALAAGRATRAPSTFERMERWIEDGNAVLFAARQGRAIVGYSLVMLFGTGAYYASACNHPDARDLPVSHVLQWRTIEWLKEREFLRYEVGWQPFHPVPHYIPTGKEISIARFKRGFGGVTVPLYAGEKFYSAKRFSEVHGRRTAMYAEASAFSDDAVA